MRVIIIAKSLQMVTCEVMFPDSDDSVVVSIVYAANEAITRKELWEELLLLSVSLSGNGKPWIMLGDFNQVLCPAEHSQATSLNVNRRMKVFRDCLFEAELCDLVFKGNTFTWWNKSATRPVAKKLDRILVNESWCSRFPSAYAVFGEPDFSDHASCGVIINPLMHREKRPFRFYNFLLQNPDFISLVGELWYSINVVGSSMFKMSKKLKALKNPIRTFSMENFSNLEKRVKEAHNLVLYRQNKTLSDPTIPNAALEMEAQRKWLILVKAEESFFCQRSRVTWMGEGDSNTSYFHRMADSRKAVNTIHIIIDDNGVKIDTQLGIKEHCIEYFSNLLGGEVGPPMLIQEDFDLLLPFRCSHDQKKELAMSFSRQDIKSAFFSFPSNKTSGPDGFPVEFFKETWSVIGTEVTDAVSEFFTSSVLFKKWNATTLVLIPKITNASKMNDFRPISCNDFGPITLYKVIARLLTNRLQCLLSQVISPFQSAFLPGRFLAENVLLATELVQGYNRQNIDPRGMLKVDLRKAFDSIRWDFIISALKAIGIPDRFVYWITQCISTPTFSVCVNGNTGGFFKSTRGLRQGNPLSPFLFVLAMEVFSSLLNSRFQAGYIHYHPKTSPLSISHLMFADDIMVFFDGGSSSLHGISEALEDFAFWSGLVLNREKTHLYLAGLDRIEASTIARYDFPI